MFMEWLIFIMKHMYNYRESILQAHVSLKSILEAFLSVRTDSRYRLHLKSLGPLPPLLLGPASREEVLEVLQLSACHSQHLSRPYTTELTLHS